MCLSTVWIPCLKVHFISLFSFCEKRSCLFYSTFFDINTDRYTTYTFNFLEHGQLFNQLIDHEKTRWYRGPFYKRTESFMICFSRNWISFLKPMNPVSANLYSLYRILYCYRCFYVIFAFYWVLTSSFHSKMSK